MPQPQPRPHAENHRTMNPPERSPSHHSNGQASSHALHPAGPRSPRPVPARLRCRRSSADRLGVCFPRTQENLASLQRLAEQTADLHRQFLEGQERTQQTFLKLLENQQGRLAFETRRRPSRPSLPRTDRTHETATSVRRRPAHRPERSGIRRATIRPPGETACRFDR